jgi:hypothetical protein
VYAIFIFIYVLFLKPVAYEVCVVKTVFFFFWGITLMSTVTVKKNLKSHEKIINLHLYLR